MVQSVPRLPKTEPLQSRHQAQCGASCEGAGRLREAPELRGRDAHTHISREVRELREAIKRIGEPGKVVTVEFGKLFEHYVTISNKLVGILLRARKQGLVEFDGEMLWQGRDDHVVITLLS